MRIYEELFIVRPDATEEEIDAYNEQIKNLITGAGGTVEKIDKWGVRKLAYKVEKRSEGFYVLFVFSAKPDLVREIERRMRVSDLVIKFISVRIDEKLKKIEKRKKIREKRAKRRPAPSLAPGAPTAEQQMMAAAAETPAPVPGAPIPGQPAPAAPAAPAPAAAPEQKEQ